MAFKRFRNGKWRFRITMKGVIDKPMHATFEKEADGDAWAIKAEALLRRGIIPAEYDPKAATPQARKLLKDVISDAVQNGHVSRSDESILTVIADRLPTTPLSSINYQWCEKWLQYMKRVEHLSPVTIRHHVGALARLLDQFAKRGDIPSNPLRALSRGYSTYSRNDIAALPKGKVARIEQERDRRLSSKEEENIRKVLDGSKETKLVLPERDALTLMFIWALESAMRLQEIYTLDHAQVDLRRKTFFLDKTKNGDKRQVPMTSIAITAYQAYRQGKHPTGLVFPFWDGEDSIESRKRATAKLSQQFARIFEAAQCGDLRFHDLRHEATSRFFERSTLSDTEIAKITGHRSPRMLMRYANLRGSVLAGRLW